MDDNRLGKIVERTAATISKALDQRWPIFPKVQRLKLFWSSLLWNWSTVNPGSCALSWKTRTSRSCIKQRSPALAEGEAQNA
jgi:hypothetical protein